MHGQRWAGAGRPDLDSWLADPPAVKPPAVGAVCRIARCADEFAARVAETPRPAEDIIRLDSLGSHLSWSCNTSCKPGTNDAGAGCVPTPSYG
jgi:hypothetical protein